MEADPTYTRLGHGEPVDLYDDPELASDLEEWTARKAAELDKRWLARQALVNTKEVDV